MFSNSSSYLGGGNSARPGPAQYGQQSQPNVTQQSNGFAPQQTGFGQTPLQQQYTGMPGQSQFPQGFSGGPQQPQPTGYSQLAQQPSFNQFQQQTQIPQPTSSSTALASVPLKTGQTSSQIAQSFTSNGPSTPTPTSSASGAKIPKIRLSFLTATDQAKFEQLFKSAVGEAQALDGEKCKDLLLRSNLPGADLMKIWTLSDTTKSGQLLFPEFALAMYLCNLRLVGKDLPTALPDKISNEVSSMVDIISFGVPDNQSGRAPSSNAPNFGASTAASSGPSIHQPQPQASNTQLLSQINSQPTGFAAQYIPPQPTGFGSQQPSLQLQQTGYPQQQQPGGFLQNPQPSGYQGPRPPLPPMPSSYSSTLSPAQTGQQQALPLNAQPTGRPGQWGLVNAPSTGLPNIDALHQRMMPQSGREGGYTTAGLAGSGQVPWAVTKDEKRIYDDLFKAWDGLGRGFIGGDTAIEMMGQSGLAKADLERIWTLSDPNNRGRLDMDEFAVAMHLVYRKLNGYPVPNQLPPELVPPSTRNFSSSIDTVKSLLSQDAESRKNSGAYLQPQKTGVSYLKNRSFRSDTSAPSFAKKDATIFRNNDDDFGYKSSARRRFGGAGGRTPSPALSASPGPDTSAEDLSLEQLKKQVREKQILLDAMDFKDENALEEEDALDRRDRREAEDLYRRIRRIQEDIDSHPKASLGSSDSVAERRNLKRQLQRLTDRLPELASQVRKLERSIADSKLELFRLKDAKAHPNSAPSIVGTGPGGTVTEGDRLKARAKALMQQRSAALLGKSAPGGSEDDGTAAATRLQDETSRAKSEKESNESMLKDVEDSVNTFTRTLEDNLADVGENSSKEHERRRWEEGLGVEEEVRDFIFDMQRTSRAARIRQQERGRPDSSQKPRSALSNDSRDVTPRANARQPEAQDSKAAAATGGSYATYKTAEDRAAFIKQQAEQRMAERLAALGLKPPAKASTPTQQKQSREAEESQDRLRQAEQEDSERESERRRRLADEQPTAPEPSKPIKKAPPAPPVRKSRADSASIRGDRRTNNESNSVLEAEHEGMEKAIKDQQQIQASETKAMINEAQGQEAELERERQESAARLKALEEQVRQGKVKKQEEKRRKEAAAVDAREREAKLSAHRAELEAAKERERQLQLQLEKLGNEDSSDEEGPVAAEPRIERTTNGLANSPSTSRQPPALTQSLPSTVQQSGSAREASTDFSPPADIASPESPAPVSHRTSFGVESKNPYFKKMTQQPDQQAAVTSPPLASESTNPFHRIAQQQDATKSQPLSSLSATPTGTKPSRHRPEEDEWSVAESSSSSDDDEGPEKPTGGSAKQLASMLFGSMGPPRPLSAMDDKTTSATPTSPAAPSLPAVAPPMPGSFDADTSGAPGAPPPPPPPAPPAPPSGAPPAPPPPPPPGPSGGPPAPPAPPAPGIPSAPAGGLLDRSGLLGDIQKGKGLKKVQTKDRSSAATAGKVLD